MHLLNDSNFPVGEGFAIRKRTGCPWAILGKLAGIALMLLARVGTGHANTCAPATSGGTAASDWSTFCWFDFTGYNDTQARSAGGQAFSFSLNDGSALTLTLNATSSAASALSAVAAPSWSGAAVGNTAFIGIPGSPVLYTANNGSTVTLTLKNIQVTPPGGIAATSGWAIVAADAESTNGGESLAFTTNGGNWVQLETVPPISGASYPTLNNAGATVTETGVAGTVGSYIFGTNNSPTTVSSKLVAGGLQGVMFAVRYAWVSVNKSINGARLNANDQFKYSVGTTTGGTQLAAASSSGAGSGPFTAAHVTISAGYPVTIAEIMAAGSVSLLSSYVPSLTCTNAKAGSPSVMPAGAAVTSYNLGTLAYGDGVSCVFTNTPKVPALTVQKTSAVVSDPANGTTNPKRIPGAVVLYTITATNSGPGTIDANSLVMTDPVPANTVLCVSALCGNPVEFIDGSPTSGLSFNSATNVSYSKAVGGGTPFSYTPVPDANGFDAAVTGVRIAPTGTMAGASSGNPSFTIRFRIKVK